MKNLSFGDPRMSPKKIKSLTVLGASVALAASLQGAGFAGAVATPLTPSDFNKGTVSGDPVASAMGGAYLLNLSGASAGYYNPSRTNISGGIGGIVSVGATAHNANVNDAENLINHFKDLQNDVSNNSSNVTTVQNDINNVWYDAQKISDGGMVSARIEPLIGVSLGVRAAVVATSDIQGGALVNTSGNPSGNAAGVTLRGAGLGISTVAVPFVIPMSEDGATIGIMPKYMRADYQGFSYDASYNSSTLSLTNDGGSTEADHAYAADLDLGASAPLAEGLMTGTVVARHLLCPNFSIPGNSFRLDPEFDAGIGASKMGITGVAEVHNLSSSNDSGITAHIGAEVNVLNVVAVRGGFDNGTLVYGLGLHTGPLLINAALGSKPNQDAALSVSYNLGL